jgi:hypothetical protein
VGNGNLVGHAWQISSQDKGNGYQIRWGVVSFPNTIQDGAGIFYGHWGFTVGVQPKRLQV